MFNFPLVFSLRRLIFNSLMLLLGQEKEGKKKASFLAACALCIPQFVLGHSGLAILNSVNLHSSKDPHVNCSLFHYLRAGSFQFQIIASIYRAWSQKPFKRFIKLFL